ncbi:unnamed protein product [Calypogeia fissa]
MPKPKPTDRSNHVKPYLAATSNHLVLFRGRRADVKKSMIRQIGQDSRREATGGDHRVPLSRRSDGLGDTKVEDSKGMDDESMAIAQLSQLRSITADKRRKQRTTSKSCDRMVTVCLRSTILCGVRQGFGIFVKESARLTICHLQANPPVWSRFQR